MTGLAPDLSLKTVRMTRSGSREKLSPGSVGDQREFAQVAPDEHKQSEAEDHYPEPHAAAAPVLSEEKKNWNACASAGSCPCSS